MELNAFLNEKLGTQFNSLKCDFLLSLTILAYEEKIFPSKFPMKMTMEVLYDSCWNITFEFFGVRKFTLPTLHGGMIEFGELTIVKKSNKELGEPEYWLTDDLLGLHFRCSDIKVIDIKKVS